MWCNPPNFICVYKENIYICWKIEGDFHIWVIAVGEQKKNELKENDCCYIFLTHIDDER